MDELCGVGQRANPRFQRFACAARPIAPKCSRRLLPTNRAAIQNWHRAMTRVTSHHHRPFGHGEWCLRPPPPHVLVHLMRGGSLLPESLMARGLGLTPARR